MFIIFRLFQFMHKLISIFSYGQFIVFFAQKTLQFKLLGQIVWHCM